MLSVTRKRNRIRTCNDVSRTEKIGLKKKLCTHLEKGTTMIPSSLYLYAISPWLPSLYGIERDGEWGVQGRF